MRAEAPPTARQVWALAAVLCAGAGETFPQDRASASELIERLRFEQGHPAPRLDDAPFRPRRSRGRGTEKLARAIAAELARELR
jgi:hypothetical protein